MAMKSVEWLLITQWLQTVQQDRGVIAALIAAPADTNTTVGSQVRLSCSTDAKTDVNWQYGVDLNSVTDIYIATEGLVMPYRRSNRHKIDVNTTTGQYDLVISNVTEEDDGFYICSEPGEWGVPPHARLIVTGSDLSAKVCRDYVVAIKGRKIQLRFSTCSPEPYYLSHVPVGESHSNDVYNLQRLLNRYAESGRFVVQGTSEGLKLKITNVQVSDAGTYTCRGNSGHGERHNKELVVLDEMPTCTDNISDVDCIETITEITELSCAVNYTGSCAPHSIWYYEYGNKCNSIVQQEFTSFNQTYSRVELKTITTIKGGTWLLCNIENPASDVALEFQCNTSVVPEQCKQQQHDTSNEVTSDFSNTRLILLITIPLVLIGFFVICGVYTRTLWIKHKGQQSQAPPPVAMAQQTKLLPG